MLDPKLESSYRALRAVYVVVPIVAGIDKFTNLLANWVGYLSPAFRSLLPVAPETFMHAVGVIEIVAGLIVLAKPRVGAWVVAAWLCAIALDLIVGGAFDIAVRDLAMAFGAGTLARLAEVAAPAREPRSIPVAREARAHA
jgi:uncharacterized membrane protein YphA (DoxX/SURF4 family)